MRSSERLYKSPVLLILVIITVILTILQFTNLERIKQTLLSTPGPADALGGISGRLSDIVGAITVADMLLFSIMAVTIILAVFLEIRSRVISRDFSRLADTEIGTITILIILAAASARFYLAPGELTLGDSPIHMSRTYAAMEAILSGSWPSWSFYNYCGFPLLHFYSPGFFVITGVISILTKSPEWTVKVILFLMHAGSAFPVYYWARTMGASRPSSLLSGAAVTLSFLHTHTVIWTGALPVSAIFLFYPLILLAIEKMLHGGSGRWVVILAAATSSIVLSHHGYAAYGLQVAAVYLALRWLLPGKGRPRLKSVIRAGLAIFAGLLFSSFFLYPIFTEGRWVFHPDVEWILRPSIPDLAFLKSLLVWRNIWSGWTVAYMGLSVFIFFLAGSLKTFRGSRGGKTSAAAGAAVIAALFAIACAAGRGRVINLALPFIAIIAGQASAHDRHERSTSLSLILLVILLVDLGPTTIQSPFRKDRSFIRKGLMSAARTVSPERVFTGYHDGSGWTYPHWRYSEGDGIFQPAGFFPQGAPRMINTVTATLDNLNACGDSLDAQLMDELYLLNVAGLVMRTRDIFIKPVPSGTGGPATEPPLSWILPSSPLIYSSRAINSTPDSLTAIQDSEILMDLPENDEKRRAYSRLVTARTQMMEIDRANASAGKIFLWPGRRPASDYQAVESDGGPLVSISRHTVSLDHAEIRFTTERPGWIRASFSWYPSIRAVLDGREATIYRSILGACVLQVPAGEHTLELSPAKSNPIPGMAGLLLGLITLGSAVSLKS